MIPTRIVKRHRKRNEINSYIYKELINNNFICKINVHIHPQIETSIRINLPNNYSFCKYKFNKNK